jgi:phage gp29-like protein
MVAELQGVGSRAASETAKSRQAEINDADRDICVGSMGEIFRWITLFNFGNGVAPPSIEFYKPEKAGKDRAETYQTAANMGARPSRSAMLEELGIPQAESDDDALLPVQPPAQPVVKPAPAVPTAAAFSAWRELPAFKFARDAGMTDEEAQQLATEAADQTIEDRMIAPVAAMLERYEAEGKILAEFSDALQELVGAMDDEALREVLDRALSFSILRGAATRAD